MTKIQFGQWRKVNIKEYRVGAQFLVNKDGTREFWVYDAVPCDARIGDELVMIAA